MRLEERDILELYKQVEDLTDKFRYLNPVIFLENKIWLKMLTLLDKPKTIKELKNDFDMTENGLRKILTTMKKHKLVDCSRKMILEVKPQQSPYNWQLTNGGFKLVKYINSKYKASQRLVIFRCITCLSLVSFATLLNKNPSVLSNLESGNRAIMSIATADKYTQYIKKINFYETNINAIINGWEKINKEIKEKRMIRIKCMTFEDYSKMGKVGGRAGDKSKKRTNLIKQISKQPPTRYEKLILSFLEKEHFSYELHPIICDECFDFRIGDIIIEVEDKRNLGQAYYKAYKMNVKARKVKNVFPNYKFLALIQTNTAPEIIRKLSEEYYVYIYPEDDKLIKYTKALQLIKSGLNLPQILRELKISKSSLESRFKKLTKYQLIKKIMGRYRNQWLLTELGDKFLLDYHKSTNLLNLKDYIKTNLITSYNENITTFIAMRYWFFVNPSGHITKSKYLNSSEQLVNKLMREVIGYISQYKITNFISSYPIERLFDGFIPPNKIVEVKTINSNSRAIFNLSGGPIVELLGQCMFLKDFNQSFKTCGIILGKYSNINRLPLNTNNLISKYIDNIYTKENLGDLKNVN